MSNRSRAQGQLSLFDSSEEDKLNSDVVKPLSEFETSELLSMEKSVLGLYLTGHPLQSYFQDLSRICTLNSADLYSSDESSAPELAGSSLKDGDGVVIAGIITAIKKKTTKTNSVMAFLTVEDLFGSFEVILFPKTYEKYGKLISQDMIAVFNGRLNVREDEEPNIYCSSVSPIDSFKVRNDTGFARESGKDFYVRASKLDAVKAFCGFFSSTGKTEEIRIFTIGNDGSRSAEPAARFNIMFSADIKKALESICN